MKKIMAFMLIGLVLNSFLYVSSAYGADISADAAKEAALAARLKTELEKFGVGKEAKVDVKLKDGTKLSGYLSEIGDEEFVVTAKNDDPRRVRYDQVRKAKGRHRHHKFALSASILGLALGVLLFALGGGSDSDY